MASAPIRPSDSSFSLGRAVKAGELGEDEAIERWSHASHWVWVAIDPVSKLLLSIDVSERTLAMAQRMVHQVRQVLAPGCLVLCRTDGLKDDGTGLLTHVGHWVQPSRRQATGLVPTPHWMPFPERRYVRWSNSIGAAGW